MAARAFPTSAGDHPPGVFAVGDVRAGNIKRVASAVGEGSIAIARPPGPAEDLSTTFSEKMYAQDACNTGEPARWTV